MLVIASAILIGCNQQSRKLQTTVVTTPNDNKILVELAHTPEQQQRGFQGRENIPFGTGMLFLFEEAAPRTFRMKDMLVPIDMVWLADEKIVGMVENAQPAEDKNIPIFTSPVPVDAVLEIPSGATQRYNLKIGEEFVIP